MHIIIKDAVCLKLCYVCVSVGHVSVTVVSFHEEEGKAFGEEELPGPLPEPPSGLVYLCFQLLGTEFLC